MAKVVTNNYFRNAFSAGSKPRLLIEIGRDYDETRGHFKYPTFFRNFCYGGDLRIHNIHVQESAGTPTSSDNNVLYYDHIDAALSVNAENMSRILSTASYSLNTSSSIQGISSVYYKPRGVFTRGDTIDLLDKSSGAFAARSFIVGGSEGGTTGVKKSLFSGDSSNRLFIKTPAGLDGSTYAYAYTINRDYFDEVTSPPTFQNSIDRLGGLASSGSVNFSLSNIKSPDTRQNWQQNISEGLSDFWSQFLYNQGGDMLDNIENTDVGWGIEGSDVKIYLVYCEDTIYRGKCKISKVNEAPDKITQLIVAGSDYHKWTYFADGARLLKSTDTLVLHNKVSDGSVDANCISYAINPATHNELLVTTDFPVGANNDEYYYSIKRKDNMSWEDYYTGRMLMFDGKITTISNISKSDITLTADSRSYTDIKDRTFGWEKVDTTISKGINKHFSHPTVSFGANYEIDAAAGGKTMPIMMGDARLFNIHETPIMTPLAGQGTTYENDPSYALINARNGQTQGIHSYITPIPIASKSITTQDYAWNDHDNLNHYWTEDGVTYDLFAMWGAYMSNRQRHAKGRAYLISKYPLYMHEHFCDGSTTKSRFQQYPSRISGELTVKSGDVRGMLFPQRFRSNDNCQGTIVWAHIDDERTENSGGELSGTGVLNGEFSYRSVNAPMLRIAAETGHYYPINYLFIGVEGDATIPTIGALVELSGSRMYNASVVPVVWRSSWSIPAMGIKRGFWVDMGTPSNKSEPFQWNDDGGPWSGGYYEDDSTVNLQGDVYQHLASGKGIKTPAPAYKGTPIFKFRLRGTTEIRCYTSDLKGAAVATAPSLYDLEMFDPTGDAIPYMDPATEGDIYVDIWHTTGEYYDVENVKVTDINLADFAVDMPAGNQWSDIKAQREIADTGDVGDKWVTRTDISFNGDTVWDELDTVGGNWDDLIHDPDNQTSLISSDFPVDNWILISGASNGANNGYFRVLNTVSTEIDEVDVVVKLILWNKTTFVTEAAGNSIVVRSVTPVGFWDFAGNKHVNWKQVSHWHGGIKDYPHVRWCLMPNSEKYNKGGDGSYPALNFINWKANADMSSYGKLKVAQTATAQQFSAQYSIAMQDFTGGFAPHYHLKHITAVVNNLADLNCFSVFTSMFMSRSTASDYAGYTDSNGDAFYWDGGVSHGIGGGLAIGYRPEWADNPWGIIADRIKALNHYSIPVSPASPDRIMSAPVLINGDFISAINRSVVVGIMSDRTGMQNTSGMLYEYLTDITNVDPTIYLYSFKLLIDTFQQVGESDLVYNGYGSPIGGWCSGRTVSGGFDEEHADELAVRIDSFSTANGKATRTQYGTDFTIVDRYFVGNFEDTTASPFSSVRTGDVMVFNRNSTVTTGGSISNITYNSPSWATMDGSGGLVNGEFIVGEKVSTSKLRIVDSYNEKQKYGASGSDETSLWSSHHTPAKFPYTTMYSGTGEGTTYCDGLKYKILEGKPAVNPSTQLEQLLRWELFWDSTAIDENSFNTVSNDRSSWEGFILIEEEVAVQDYVNEFCQSMGMSAWITANGKLKIKATDSNDPYTATQVNSRKVAGMTAASGNAPSETLNMCSSNPHVGFQFDFDYRYQCSTGELSSFRVYETNIGTPMDAVFTSADNTNDPIAVASTLASRLTAASPTSWTYTVIFDYDTQKFTIDAGSGHAIFAIGSLLPVETNHDSVCNLFGFHKVYRTVGAQTLTSDFPISTLPIHGHMIVKDSLSISKTTISSLVNEVTVKYNANSESVVVTDTDSIAKYGTYSQTYDNAHILHKATANLYANFLLDKLSVPKITVKFSIAGASGIVFEVSDHIAISHELLQSIYGTTYNAHGGGTNGNTKFRVLSTSYSTKSNKVQISAEAI